MSLGRKALNNKILVLGIDGMDPRLTRKLVDEGKMPNTKKFIERGAQRNDLVMLGGQPTVTPPMWTTLATGAYPCTHGITCFTRQSEEDLDVIEYNLDSRKCKAEQLWNVFAEAGKKTLVWHWPGSSWPPSSDSPNLHVVDGTQPGTVNIGVAKMDKEKVLVASANGNAITYRQKAAKEGKVPCVIDDLGETIEKMSTAEKVNALKIREIILTYEDGEGLASSAFDASISTIRNATGWANAPENAKEFVMLHSEGLTRRPCLILTNEQGIYDRVAIYQSKKDQEPIAVLIPGQMAMNVLDEAIKGETRYTVNRNMRVLELSEDGDYLRIWISAGMDITNDSVWHPKRLYKEVIDNVGYAPPISLAGGSDPQLFEECMKASWDVVGKWQGDALKHLIKTEEYDVVFSHFHNIDLEGHLTVKFMKKGNKLPGEAYQKYLEQVYVQTDEYIGQFLYLLDEGWTIFIVSDHAQVCPEHMPPLMCEAGGLSATLFSELGYTVLKKDENGNPIKEIDWSKTRAVQVRENHIYLNIKGRNKYGIVDPEDKYELEEQLMTDLYGYKDPETGKRVVALALRNKDAYLLGLGGPECGDIILFNAEGYNYDHCDSLSTTYGYANTSVSPIFMAAGKGLKKGFTTDRIIREVDLAPTVAAVGGVRMPKQCEGAPVYQILAEEF